MSRTYCHTHSAYGCQTCADEILSLGIQVDKDRIKWLESEVARLEACAARGRLLIEHGEWIRRNHDTDEAHALLAIRLPYDADLSCKATREDAIDAAIAQGKGE